MVFFCFGMKIVEIGLAFIHLACTVHLNITFCPYAGDIFAKIT
jgi:hypothetical protein